MFTIKSVSQLFSVSLIIVFLLALTFSAAETTTAQALAATTWYVSTSGNDASNSCSNVSSACRTIHAALGKASAGDTIEVAIGTYTGTGTEVVLIDKGITLSGGWNAAFTTQSGLSVIDGQAARRGIYTTGDPVVVEYFRIQHGFGGGAGGDFGGGIYNYGGTLTLNNSVVSNNVSHWMGGGIENYGTLTINDTVVSNNSAGDGSVGGGGGGGIDNYTGTVVLNNSTISGNTIIGGFSGSGIHNGGTSFTINDSTISANTNAEGIYNTGYMSLNSSTVSGNTNGIINASGNISIQNSTISANEFGITNKGGQISLQNSILAGNTVAGQGRDCVSNNNASINSTGYNLIGISACAFTASKGDQIGNTDNPINAVLGPLQDNGGPTFTHALLGGSPALNGGNPATPGSGGSACPASDQRGVARATGPCDIGAYEVTTLMVASIKRVSPSPINAASVNFSVTFTETVTGVDATDFTLTTTNLTGASVTNVSGSGATYTVTVNTGSANGTLRLDLVDNDSIRDAASNPLGGVGHGNGNATSGETYTIDSTAPRVSSIVRVDAKLTNSYSVSFIMTFSEPVTGVDETDFTLAAAGPTGASITDISSSDDATTYTVTVETGSGDGAIRLDLLDDDSIMDSTSNPLGGVGATNGNFNSGEGYTIDKTLPSVLSIVRADPDPTSAASVNFTLTFSEAVTDVDATDFRRTATGLAGTAITNVNGSGATYTITVNTGSGSGTLHIDLIDNGSIEDLATNDLMENVDSGNGDFTSGETYTVKKSKDAGPLDATFGTNGIVTTDEGDREGAKAMVIQPDGKIVMIGYSYYTYGCTFLLERYTANGSLDTTFGNGGVVETPISNYAFGDALAIQPDGKIIASGFTDFGVTLVRYKTDGSLDPTFGTRGEVTTLNNNGFNSSVAIQPNGQIVVAGDYSVEYNQNFVVERYNSNGSLDTSFGAQGKVSTDFGSEDSSSAMVIQPDGKIIVVGTNGGAGFALARYNKNGSPDASFGSRGKVTTKLSGGGSPSAVAIQPDGKIIVAGGSPDPGSIVLARYNTNGSLDKTFDIDGKVITKVGKSSGADGITLQPDGRIMVSGSSDNGSVNGSVNIFALLRYKNNGALDTTFGSGGVVTTAIGDGAYATGSAFQPDGKLIVAGSSSTDGNSDFTLARYNVDYWITASIAAHDGWLLESSENSNKGGALNSSATTFKLGADAANQQYRGILSFSTGSLPDNAVITSVTLKVRKQGVIGGGNPAAIFGGFMVDVKKGFFGTKSALQISDFQAAATKSYGPFNTSLVGGWYNLNLTSVKASINKGTAGSGLTQLRLRFKLDDNNNAVANILSLYSGNAPTAANRPQLVITYYVP